MTNSGTITVGGTGAGTAGTLSASGITNNAGATITVNATGNVTDTLNNSGTVTNSGIYNAHADQHRRHVRQHW